MMKLRRVLTIADKGSPAMRCSPPLVAFVLLVCPAFAWAGELPWEVNPPIVTVQKSLYFERPPSGTAYMGMEYVGPNLELRESRSLGNNRQTRLSTDNGKTWSAWQPLPPTHISYNGVGAVECEGPRLYDAQTGVLVQTWLRQINPGYHNHTYSAISQDHGATWSTPQPLKYEASPDFDPNNPSASDHLTTNVGYFSSSILQLSNGNLLVVVGSLRPENRGGLIFIGQWNSQTNDYQWTPGNRVTVPADKSLNVGEADMAQLKDGRVLVIWRGDNTFEDPTTMPARKWYSIATEKGMDFTTPAELKYDDGSSFYSPGSYHRLIRSSVTGKLYWLGNISATPPEGGNPRYPLVIAEVDEAGATPALKKNTVTVIDTRQPGQPEKVQYSNFSVLENRETHDFDMYMTMFKEAPNIRYGTTYKYVVTLVP